MVVHRRAGGCFFFSLILFLGLSPSSTMTTLIATEVVGLALFRFLTRQPHHGHDAIVYS